VRTPEHASLLVWHPLAKDPLEALAKLFEAGLEAAAGASFRAAASVLLEQMVITNDDRLELTGRSCRTWHVVDLSLFPPRSSPAASRDASGVTTDSRCGRLRTRLELISVVPRVEHASG
jgi:hypothetical protein